MENKKIRVAITHGDTNGIGYETILKAFEDPMMLELCTPIIYGSPKVAAFHRKALHLETQYNIINSAEEAHDGRLNLLATFDDDVKVEFGQPTDESAEAARKAMARAKEDLIKHLYDVLVTAPVKPANTQPKEDKSLTVMVSEAVRIGLVTTHLPLKDVPAAITVEKVSDKARIFHQSLKRDFRISSPRIAILALNPQEGTEEKDVIRPAIAALEKEGIQAFGPFVADQFFGDNLYEQFDGVLAMYDDQGSVPFKTLAQEYGVKLKAGISAIVTTPDQDPSFDIAGKGVADEHALRQAVYTAIDMYRHRIEYDEPMGNPLPKLYHEKREDVEKIRFAIPKPKEQFKREDRKQSEPQEQQKPE
jgi:4-hydroxythreonine-4-phosphate dehydrogenase